MTAAVAIAALVACSSGTPPTAPPDVDDRPVPDADRPDLVVLLADDAPHDSVGPAAMPYLSSEPYGHWWRTTMTYNLPLCCPSRATLLTGRTASHHGVTGNLSGDALEPDDALPVALQRAGYTTCKVGKYLNGWPFGDALDPPVGWDRWAVLADFDNTYGDYVLSVDGRPVEHGHGVDDYSTTVLLRHAIDCIEDAPTDRPLYLDVGFNAPHGPFTPPAEHADDPIELPPPAASFNEADVDDKVDAVQDLPLLSADDVAERARRKRDAYRSLRGVDDAIRELLVALDGRRGIDETIVVYTSDNANAFGEHRITGKRCWYDPCATFPLLIRYPGGPTAGRVDDHLVGNIDVAPTLAALAGAALPVPPDGRSLVPLLDGEDPAWRDALLLEDRVDDNGPNLLGIMWGLRTERWLYVELDDGQRELYDLDADPDQLDNIAGRAETATVQADLSERITELRAE